MGGDRRLAAQLAEMGDLGRARDPGGCRQLQRTVVQPVLQQEVEIVALVEDLAAHVGVELTQAANLAILLSDQPLVHRGDLDVDALISQIEVGGEVLRRIIVLVEVYWKRRRLILPIDTVEIEQTRELPLADVGEFFGLGTEGLVRVGCLAQLASAVSVDDPTTSSCCVSGKSS